MMVYFFCTWQRMEVLKMEKVIPNVRFASLEPKSGNRIIVPNLKNV